MAQVIIYTNENGGVSLTIPTPEYLETHTIEDVLNKDCPDHAIIVDESELPEDQTYFNAWELVDGVVVVNQTKKQAIIDEAQAKVDAKQSALVKLMALGLTEEEALALGVK
jgi:hypothetical protein